MATLKLRQIFLKPRRVHAVQLTTLLLSKPSCFMGNINPIPFTMIIFAGCRKKGREKNKKLESHVLHLNANTQNNNITVHICNTVDCEIGVEFFV